MIVITDPAAPISSAIVPLLDPGTGAVRRSGVGDLREIWGDLGAPIKGQAN
jgi:hypothetical protein